MIYCIEFNEFRFILITLNRNYLKTIEINLIDQKTIFHLPQNEFTWIQFL